MTEKSHSDYSEKSVFFTNSDASKFDHRPNKEAHLG